MALYIKAWKWGILFVAFVFSLSINYAYARLPDFGLDYRIPAHFGNTPRINDPNSTCVHFDMPPWDMSMYPNVGSFKIGTAVNDGTYSSSPSGGAGIPTCSLDAPGNITQEGTTFLTVYESTNFNNPIGFIEFSCTTPVSNAGDCVIVTTPPQDVCTTHCFTEPISPTPNNLYYSIPAHFDLNGTTLLCDTPKYNNESFGSYKIGEFPGDDLYTASATVGTGLCTGSFNAPGNILMPGVNYLTMYLDTNFTQPYGFVEFYCTDPVINPGDCVIVTYSVDPVICVENCFSNVLFLPGLEASRLYNTREDGSEDQLWEPNSNSDIEDLYLDINGESINSDIYTRDIIKSGQGVQKIYKSFSDMLDQLKSENKIKDWKAFAYDWRQDINDIVNNGTKYQGEILSLTDTLQSLIGPASKNGKVTIVTHSNGGLLAKAFLSKLQDDKNSGINNLIDNVDVLIMVGAPQIGTPAAVPAVMHGYDQDILGGLLMDKIHARELGRKMLGAYGLLPSREYINRVSSSPVTFVDNIIPSNITTAMFQTFGSAVDSYSEYKDFIFGAEGRVNPPITQIILPINLSQNLYSKAEILHDEIDNWTPPETLKVIQIAGWGVSTIASFEYYPKCSSIIPQNLICELDERPRFTLDGDKTVVTPSANYMEGVVDYWVNLKKYNKDSISIFSANHKNILELSPILDLLSNIMNGSNSYDSNYITTEEPESDSNTLQLSIHSPATIDAYDSFGNHTGRVCVEGEDFCSVEEQIPNSTYLEFGEGKYLNLPEDNFSRIEIKGIGTGTFTYESEKVYPNGNSVITAFKDIPVDSNTLAEITKNSDESLTLALDQDGNGTIDKTIESELGDVTVYDTTPPEIELSFSTLKKEVIFSGIDDSQVNVTHSKVSTKVIDKQGNTSILYYNRYKEGHDKLRLFFNKIVRNGVVTTLPNTVVEYSWKVNKKGTLTDLDTKVIIKGEEAYFFNYRKSTNVTTIFKKEGKIFTVVTKRGFVPVSIVTEGNSIKVIY